MKTEESSKTFQSALWYLSRQPRTISEIRKKLTDRDFDLQDIEEAIARLVQLKFLDDQKFAKNYIERSTRSKGLSRIKRELILKGVSKSIIDEESALIESDAMEESAFEIAQKKFRSLRNLPKVKIYNRLISFLIRRGFSYDEAKRAFAKVSDSSIE